MTFKNFLSKYYSELEGVFHEHHAAILIAPENDTILQLRENIKRQRAFINLIKALDPSLDTKKVVPALREFYHQMDQLRDLQVEEEVLLQEEDKLHISHRFSNVVHKEEEEKLATFREFELNFPLRPVWEGSFFVRNSIGHLTDEKIVKSIPIYFKDLEKRIAITASSAQFDDGLLGDVRTLLGEFFYNWEMISKSSFYTTRNNAVYRALPVIDSIRTLQRYKVSLEKVKSEKTCSSCLLFLLEKDVTKAKRKAQKAMNDIPYLFRSFEYGFGKMINNIERAEPSPIHFSNPQKNIGDSLT